MLAQRGVARAFFRHIFQPTSSSKSVRQLSAASPFPKQRACGTARLLITRGSHGSSVSAATMSTTTAALKYKDDLYNGAIVDPEGLPEDVEVFKAQLADSLSAWKAMGKRGIWLKVPIQRAAFVGPAVAAGFIFHHAEPDYVMLTCWLPKTPSTLPPNASTQIGVGAFVLNARGEVLLVRERSGPAGKLGIMKLPTGLLDQGEDVPAAAEREVLEECRLRTRFQAVIGFRQAHGIAFGKDDLFFLTALRLEDPAQDKIHIQESELLGAKWVSMEEFQALPHFKPGSVWGHLNSLCVLWAKGEYAGVEAQSLPTGIRPGNNATYSVGRLVSPGIYTEEEKAAALARGPSEECWAAEAAAAGAGPGSAAAAEAAAAAAALRAGPGAGVAEAETGSGGVDAAADAAAAAAQQQQERGGGGGAGPQQDEGEAGAAAKRLRQSSPGAGGSSRL